MNNRVERIAEANIPTEHGNFRVVGYKDLETDAEHLALVSCEVPCGSPTPIRIHSECVTGEALDSLKCECGPQLRFAMDYVACHGGIIFYMRGHEGRGIGLLNKLKAYALQEKGYDTVDANLMLGLPSEAREYGAAVAMLNDLGVEEVLLLSNNPEKKNFLEENGIKVAGSIPIQVGTTDENAGYLATKRDKMGHTLPDIIL